MTVRFRKRPIEIEATQWTGRNLAELRAWTGGEFEPVHVTDRVEDPEITAEVFDADGYYRTGDIVAELAPDRLAYVDRRNNVIKLSQGEFVTELGFVHRRRRSRHAMPAANATTTSGPTHSRTPSPPTDGLRSTLGP